MGRSGDSVLNLGTDLIGDRVQIVSGFIVGGEISLTIIQAGPLDAACCPTEKAIVGWRLGDSGLTRTATETIGTLSLADLQGSEWVLTDIGFDQPVPPIPEVTIQFDGDKVSGNGGCNRYFGTVTDTSPGRLEFSAMGTTMMACPDRAMELERRYLRALADGSSYGFSSGRLVIGSESADDSVALVFRRREIGRSAEGTASP
jgi:heat shock protein HslJ